MKNANVFVDVDLTLVDMNGNLLDGVRESLQALRDRGCHLFLWSSVGMEYARKTAERHRLVEFFEGFSSKPDIIIDDMPKTALPAFSYNVHEHESWPSMAKTILDRHVDR